MVESTSLVKWKMMGTEMMPMTNMTNTINLHIGTVIDLNQFISDFGEEINDKVVCNEFFLSKEIG